MNSRITGNSETVKCRLTEDNFMGLTSNSNPEEDSRIRTIVKQTLDKQDDWNRHIKEECLCKMCTCGRHLCHLHPLKFDLKMPRTCYRKGIILCKYLDFGRSDRIPNDPVHMPTERLSQQKVVSNTNYKEEFPKKVSSNDPKSVHADNLKTGGPMSGLTTYHENFFAKKSPTIPFGPADNGIFSAGYPSLGTTSYRNAYKGVQTPVRKGENPDKVPRSSSLKFIGRTSYQSDYLMPKVDQYNHKRAPSASRIQSVADTIPKGTYPINLATMYQKDFQASNLNICPAAVEKRLR